MKTYMVIGMGRFGAAIAEALFNMGHEVIILDDDEETINHLANIATLAAAGDAKDPAVLKAAGAAECDTAIVAMGEDLAASVLITMNLKDLGVRKVVCKARDEQYRRVLERVGADRVVIPEREMGVRLAQNLVSGSFLDYIELSDKYAIAEVTAPRAWAGKTLMELNVRQKYQVSILAIKEGKNMTVSPGGSHVIPAGSSVMVMGETGALSQLQKL